MDEKEKNWITRKKEVKERDHYQCKRCSRKTLLCEVHHKIPKSRGGTDELDNLITLCYVCHMQEHPSLHSYFKRVVYYLRDELSKLIPRFKKLKKMQQADYALKHIFRYPSFRSGQKKVIEEILSQKDVFVVMPTGAGKSLVYQLPAVLSFPQLTVVISPLKALQRDQVDKLLQKWVPASFINSDLQRKEKEERKRMTLKQFFTLIYLSPERYSWDRPFFDQLSRKEIAYFVVDEAHCVELWGHGFRPDYLKLKEMADCLNRPPVVALTATACLNRPPVVALTATASEQIREKIITNLEMKSPEVFVLGFNRKNISFNVLSLDSEEEKKQYLVSLLKEIKFPGLVFVATTKQAEEIKKFLNQKLSEIEFQNGQKRKIKIDFYHGRRKKEEKKEIERKFKENEIDILIATKAFGMGIDIKGIRFVIHYHLPGNITDYYQEVGRAGRGEEEKVTSVLLYAKDDEKVNQWLIENSYPQEEDIKSFWSKLCQKTGRIEGELKDENILKLLHSKGYIKFVTSRDEKKDITIWISYPDGTVIYYEVKIVKRVVAEELKLDYADINQYRDSEMRELKKMQEYISWEKCRRRYLLEYFGDISYTRRNWIVRLLHQILSLFGLRESEPLSSVPCCDNCVTRKSRDGRRRAIDSSLKRDDSKEKVLFVSKPTEQAVETGEHKITKLRQMPRNFLRPWELSVGLRVQDAETGRKGTIVDIDGSGRHTKIIINYDDVGERAHFANFINLIRC